jgi:signal transduction histidine kinase
VSDGDLPHLFEQYWQAEHGAADAGVGLGLTIAKSLVEAHGGRIMAERARSGGLTVAFTVPIAAS